MTATRVTHHQVFFVFVFFTVSIKLQVREIHRHAYKYGWCVRLRPLSALSEIFLYSRAPKAGHYPLKMVQNLLTIRGNRLYSLKKIAMS